MGSYILLYVTNYLKFSGLKMYIYYFHGSGIPVCFTQFFSSSPHKDAVKVLVKLEFFLKLSGLLQAHAVADRIQLLVVVGLTAFLLAVSEGWSQLLEVLQFPAMCPHPPHKYGSLLLQSQQENHFLQEGPVPFFKKSFH